jgi:hypothetical protein
MRTIARKQRFQSVYSQRELAVASLKPNEKAEPATPLLLSGATPLAAQANVQTSFFDRRERRTQVRFILHSSFALVPRAQFPSQQTLGTRGDLRQNAVRVFAVIIQ